MGLRSRWFRPCAAWLLLVVGAVGPALGQGRGKPKASQATLVGRVVDTVGIPIADAEVIVTRGRDTAASKRAMSNARGDVLLRDLAPGGPYTLLARRIGYGSARGTDVYLQADDTLRVDFELPPVGVTLPTITVRSRQGSRFLITAEDFNPAEHPDALNLVAWKRPYMLGDPDRCSAPPSPPWPMPVTRGIGRRPWVEASRFFDIFNPPYSPYVQRVYVNGDRIDVPGQSPLIALHEIPSDSIAEIRYVDCTDQTGAWPYSIYVVLKPPSRPVQDSIWRSIQRDSTRRDSRRP